MEGQPLTDAERIQKLETTAQKLETTAQDLRDACHTMMQTNAKLRKEKQTLEERLLKALQDHNKTVGILLDYQARYSNLLTEATNLDARVVNLGRKVSSNRALGVCIGMLIGGIVMIIVRG